MSTELPQFKRCCFCLPLRYGLIAWGYLKLIGDIFLMFPAVLALVFAVERYGRFSWQGMIITEIVVFSLVFMTLLLELVFNIIFLVGAHTKKTELLRFYYIFSIFLLVAITTLLPLITAMYMYTMPVYLHISLTVWRVVLPVAVAGCLEIMLQFYLILLVKSEIMKLSNSYNFRFENHAAEAQCVMYMDCDDVKETPEIGDATVKS